MNSTFQAKSIGSKMSLIILSIGYCFDRQFGNGVALAALNAARRLRFFHRDL